LHLAELERRVAEVAAWTRTLPEGSRYAIVQALRQTLEAAVRWGQMESNPAKLAGRNPQPKRDEVAPFEPDEIDLLAAELGPVYGPLVVVAAYTGLRPSEWTALEWRDVDRDAGVLTIERAFSYGQIKPVKTKGSRRRVPLRARAALAIELVPRRLDTRLVFPARAAPTSTCATGVSGSGSRRSMRQGYRGCGARTICGTRLRPGRSPRAFRPMTSPATWARPFGCWISHTATS
jgi:integrase